MKNIMSLPEEDVSLLKNLMVAGRREKTLARITEPPRSRSARDSRDFTNQNPTQFENTETEKSPGPGPGRLHERGKNKAYGCESDDRGRAVHIL